MDRDSALMNFIAKKREYQEKNWKIFWVFETIFLEELKEMYGKKLVALEQRIFENILDAKKIGDFLTHGLAKKKFEENIKGVKIIHVGSKEGFTGGEIVLIDDENTEDTRSVKQQRFNDAIKKIVGNKAMIPDNSVLLVSKEKHHQKNVRLKENQTTSKAKKLREKSAQSPGQRSITEFFVKIKTSVDPSPYKKPNETLLQPKPPLEIEEITQKLRGENVKILWMPKRHAEMDAAQFISVFLLNEIARLTETDDDVDLKDKCTKAVDRFPHQVWERIVKLIDDCEDFYLEEGEEDDTKQEKKEEPEVKVKQEPIDQSEIETQEEQVE